MTLRPKHPGALLAAAAMAALQAGALAAQSENVLRAPVERVVEGMPAHPRQPGEPGFTPDDPAFESVPAVDLGGSPESRLLRTPITGVFPGARRPWPRIEPPLSDTEDDASAWRGMTYYNQFNCVGCHAPNGSGGMGPSLSNAAFIYGGDPENIYLSIMQGRPAGMPAFGGMLPDRVIWDLVAYVRAISRDETGDWGKTTKLDGYTIEQVPAEYLDTIDPWSRTIPFSYGQPPFEKVETPSKNDVPGPAERLETE